MEESHGLVNQSNQLVNESYQLVNTTTLSPQAASTSSAKLDPKTDTIMKCIALSTGFVGLVLNLTIFILVLKRYKGKWRKHLILLMNILVCDMFFCMSAVVYNSARIAQIQLQEKYKSMPGEVTPEEYGLHRRFTCTAYVGKRLWDISSNASLFGLLLLTVDHLLAVRWSLKHATMITKRWVIIACALSWVIAIILGYVSDMLIGPTYVPLMDNWPVKYTTQYCYQRLIYTYGKQTGNFKSEIDYEQHDVVLASISLTVVMTTFIMMFCVYVYIASVVISVNKRRKAQNDKYRETFRNLKGVGTTILLLASFVFLYFPQTVMYLATTFHKSDKIGNLWPEIFSIAAGLSAIVDVLIYAIRSNDIRSVLCLTRKTRRKGTKNSLFTNSRSSNSTMSTTISNRTSSRAWFGTTLKFSDDVNRPLADSASSNSNLSHGVRDEKSSSITTK